MNILLLLKKRIEKVLKEKKDNTLQLELVSDFKKLNKEKSVYFLNKPSQAITEAEIPNGSVDVVITDPKSIMKAGIVEFDLKTKDIFINPKNTSSDIKVITN